jgi:serine/threonine protein kinase
VEKVTAGTTHHPATVGPYRLIRKLGEGGMGVVHLALDPAGRAVAVKVLRAHVANDEEARHRLSREVATLRRVRHPRVAEVLDADVVGAEPYVVTRFVPGRSLDEEIRATGPMPAAAAARTGRALAEAIAAIHAAGVVHRDIKPANVMLVDGDPVLIDFGIAHVADESRITRTGLVMGTPGYLAPELIYGESVTAATDWWAWGATLTFAATGRPPFGTGPIEVVLERVRRGACDLGGIESPLRELLAATLAVDAAERPWAGDLIAALDAVIAKVATAPLSGGPGAGRAGPGGYGGGPAAPIPPYPGAARPQRDVGQFAGGPPSPPPPYPPPPNPGRAYPPPPYAPPEAQYPPPASQPAQGKPFTQRQPHSNGYPYGPQQAPWAANGTVVSGTVTPTAPYPSGRPPLEGSPAPAPDHGGATDSPSQASGEPAGPRRVTGLLAALLLTLAGVAAVAPGGALMLFFGFTVLARTVYRSSAGLERRRQELGRSRTDVAVTVVKVPWRLLLALLVSVPAVIVPVLVAGSGAFIAGSLVTRSGVPWPSGPVALAVGAVAGSVTAWWGPGGWSLRGGTRSVIRSFTRPRVARIVLLTFCALVILAAVIVASSPGHIPDWSPFQAPFARLR